MIINQRLQQLRANMKKSGFDAVILPSNDPHQSEYVCDHWKIRAYFSGFSGSAGTLIVTQETAAIWTDSRYFLQAEKQCANNEVELQKQKIPHAPEHIPWLCQKLPADSVIGVDYRLFSLSQHDYLQQFAAPKNIQIQAIGDLIDTVWTDRPSLPNTPIIDHDVVYCGMNRAAKIVQLRNVLEEKKADYLLISALDEIAWAFNIRASDINYTPLPIAYALVGKETCTIFANKNRFDNKLAKELESESIQISDYANIFSALKNINKTAKILTDGSNLNYASSNTIQGEILLSPSFIRQEKAIKNPTEIAHIKKCMIKDGVALTRLYIWLEKELLKRGIKETEIARVLASFRQEQADYKGESFAAIVGYNANGAIIHYTAQEDTCATVKNEGILLLDSGGQYINGTTDITRTIALSEPTAIQKRDFTLVLKGYIGLETMHFPKGTVGMQLDTIARMHLWKNNQNFGHGTGHGVGFYALVHEAPQGFAANTVTSRGTSPMLANMLTSNEPGFYKPGEYGIRMENLILSKEITSNEFGTFLGFEAVTLCYVDTTLIDFDLMEKAEVDWLNAYHQKVLDELLPHLEADEKEWLMDKCKKQ